MKCMFVFNPQSGKGKVLKKIDFIKQKLQQKFEEVVFCETKSRQDLIDKVCLACNNFDYLIFSGGDGTVNDVINAMIKNKNKPILGYIPSGTCNDFAKSVGISKNIKRAIRTICNGQPKKFDGFVANNRFGVYVCGSGIFTSASYATKQKTKHFLGKLGYYFHSAKEIFSAKSMNISFSLDGSIFQEHNSVLFLLVNSHSVAGWKFNKNANLHDGKMDFVSIETKKKNKKIGFKALFLILRMFLFGLNSIRKSKNVKISQFQTAKIISLQNNIINIDGENGGIGNITLEVKRDLFQIIVSDLEKN